MKVFVVERVYDYEGAQVDAVFSTLALADAYVVERKKSAELVPDRWEVTEWTVDEEVRGAIASHVAPPMFPDGRGVDAASNADVREDGLVARDRSERRPVSQLRRHLWVIESRNPGEPWAPDDPFRDEETARDQCQWLRERYTPNDFRVVEYGPESPCPHEHVSEEQEAPLIERGRREEREACLAIVEEVRAGIWNFTTIVNRIKARGEHD